MGRWLWRVNFPVDTRMGASSERLEPLTIYMFNNLLYAEAGLEVHP